MHGYPGFKPALGLYPGHRPVVERLTYLFEGRQRRLTDIGGQNNLAERLQRA